ENQAAKRRFTKTILAGAFELGVGPAAFGASRERRCDGESRGDVPLQDMAQEWRVGPLRKKDTPSFAMRGKRPVGVRKGGQRGDAMAARLLRSFEKDLLPSLGPFRRGRKQCFLAAGGGERRDRADAKLGGLFQGEFESLKFHDGEKQCRLQRSLVDRHFL